MADEFVVPVGIDNESLLAGINEAAKSFDKLDDRAKQSGKVISDAMQTGAKASTTLDSALTKNKSMFGQAATAAVSFMEKMVGIKSAAASGLDTKPISLFSRFLNAAKQGVKEFALGAKEGFQDVQREAKETQKQLKNTGDSGVGLGTIVAGVFGGNLVTGLFNGLVDIGKSVFETTAKFQKFEETLTIAFGDRSAAQGALQMISDFAAKTPFQVDELTESFVKLKNRGFTPTVEELTSLGDLASSQGKSFDQLTEALLDAQTGEFERLKEFGVKASKSGDQATLTFGNFSKTVKNTGEDIRAAILEIGKLPQVAGGMEAVSKTLGGQFSNLQDSVTRLFATIGEGSSSAFATAIGWASDFISTLTTAISDGSLSDFFSPIIDGVMEYIDAVKGAIGAVVDWAESSGLMEDMKGVLNDVFTIVGNIFSAMGSVISAVVEWAQQDGIIQNAIGGALSFVWNIIKGIIHAIAEIPVYWEGVKAAVAQAVENMKLQFRALVADLEVIALKVKLAFTFDDDKEAELQKRIEAKAKEAEQARQGIKTIGVAFDEAVAKKRKEIADKEAKEDAERSAKQAAADRKKLEQEKALDAARSKKQAKAPGAAATGDDKKKTGGKTDAEVQISENTKLIKLINELRDAEISAIEDVDKQKKEKLTADLERKKAEIANEIALINEKEKKINAQPKTKANSELLATFEKEKETLGKIQVAAEQKTAKEIEKINVDSVKKQMELQADAYKELSALDENNLQLKLRVLDDEYKAKADKIKEQYKSEKELQEQLLAALNVDKSKKTQDTKIEFGQKDLKKQEDFLIASTELSQKYAGTSVEVEKMKQLAILAIKLDYAKKNVELLKEQGKTEQDQVLLDAQLLVQNLEKEFKTASKKSLAEMLGMTDKDLDSLSKAFGETGEKIAAAAKKMFDTLTDENATAADKIGAVAGILSQAAQAGIDAIQKQIDKKQEQIDLYTEQIDELESQLERERELQEDGLANNVGTLETEVAEKKRLRDEEMKHKEELQAKQIKLQKAQFIADTAAQAMSLISASADILKGFSTIPIVGLGLGIAAVAAMFAFFATAKIKAYNAIGKQTLGEGGYVIGAPHEQGGQKYVSADGRGGVVELEGGEFVIRKKNTAKHRALAEAINKDDFSGINFDDNSFMKMLSDMGIDLATNEKKETVRSAKEVNGTNSYILAGMASSSMEHYFESMDKNIKVLSDAELSRETVTETEDATIIKTAGRTRVIKKSIR